jgi:hypothetical protein
MVVLPFSNHRVVQGLEGETKDEHDGKINSVMKTLIEEVKRKMSLMTRYFR